MTKEEDFKIRLAEVLRDLQANGTDDGEAMLLLGGGAGRICDMGNKARWSELKAALSPSDTDRLIEQCRVEGNTFARDGKRKAAYAIQAIAMSLVARSQDDPEIRQGERLLDAVIEQALANFRQNVPKPRPN
jgi:hypothetical protein